MKSLVLRVLSLLGISALKCSSVSDPTLVDLAAYDAEDFGSGQRMLDTAALLGINRWDPAGNLWATAKPMSEQDDTSNRRLALAAYYAGPGNVLE